MNVVIIGGGVIGTVLTYLFSSRNVNVTLINSDLQKPRFPLIHSKLLRFPEDIRLARISEDVYGELSREVGTNVLRPVDSITIIPTTCYNDTMQIMSMWHDAGGASTRIISDVSEYGIKRVSEEEVYILSSNGDNLVNYPLLISRVRKIKGINYVNGFASIKFVDGGIKVLVNGREFRGDYVIIASGAWNSMIIRNANLKVPLLPYKCQAAAFLGRVVNDIIYDYVLGIYVRPPLGSMLDNALSSLRLSIIVGGDGNFKVTEPGRERGGVDNDFLDEVRKKVRARLGRVRLIGSRFGYCEGTPDTRPVIGASMMDYSLLVGLMGMGGPRSALPCPGRY